MSEEPPDSGNAHLYAPNKPRALSQPPLPPIASCISSSRNSNKSMAHSQFKFLNSLLCALNLAQLDFLRLNKGSAVLKNSESGV